MELIANQNIKDQIIQLDNHHFENCTVTNCVLVFSGGDFSWTNSHFTSCQLRLIGAAQRTITFLRHFGIVPQQVPKTAESTEPSSVH